MGTELSAGDPDAVEALVRALGLAISGLVGPVTGSLATLLDAMLSGRPSKLVEARVQQFLEELRAEFSRMLPADTESQQYVQSQDFAHLVVLAVQAATKERNREKLRWYARILRKTAADDRGPDTRDALTDRAEQALRALADLTPPDFIVLKALIEITGQFQVANLDPYLPRAFPRDRVRAHLARLERTGLLFDEGTVSQPVLRTTPLLDELRVLLDR